MNRHVQTGMVGVALALILVLRLSWLDSDPYSALSWSSESVTDEGFYTHDARNLVLFGSINRPGDDFHNALIMPLLHGLQCVVFRMFGYGIGQARAISIVCSLLTLLLLFAGCRRAFGHQVASVAVLFLGLDHVNLLYNRLALMDTPAQLPMVACFYAFVRVGMTTPEQEFPRRFWSFVCGVILAVGYSVRGLSALLIPIPILLLGLPAITPEKQRLRPLLWLLFGLACGLGLYLTLWYIPNRAELHRVNAYYVGQQLLPHSLNAIRNAVNHALLGDQRGFSSYLFRHSPILFGLALTYLATWPLREPQTFRDLAQGKANARTLFRAFIALWLLICLLCFALIRYAPPRYYILFYPALAILAALSLAEVQNVLAALWRSAVLHTLFGSWLTYHIAEAGLHHRNAGTEITLYGLTGLAFLLLLLGRKVAPAGVLRLDAVRWQQLTLALWLVVNTGWLLHWATHIGYSLRDADRWLAENTPTTSVLIGDSAPGLALRNGRSAIAVIPGLCNDAAPLEAHADRPRYVLIFVGQKPYLWWRMHFPSVIVPKNRVQRFSLLGKFNVDVYADAGH